MITNVCYLTKKTTSDCVVPSQMGDSVGMVVIMRLNSEQCRSNAAGRSRISRIWNYPKKFKDSKVLLLNFIGICMYVLLKTYAYFYILHKFWLTYLFLTTVLISINCIGLRVTKILADPLHAPVVPFLEMAVPRRYLRLMT